LTKRGKALDVERHRGAATDEQKRDLLLVAVRQAVDGFDRSDLVQLSSRLLAYVDERLDARGLTKEVRKRTRESLKRKICRRLEEADRSAGADISTIEDDIGAQIEPLARRVAFTVAVAAEATKRVEMGILDDAAASMLEEWSRRSPLDVDAVTFVDECLSFEARRQADPSGLLRASLGEMWPALLEWDRIAKRWAQSSEKRRREEGEALPDAISDATDGLITNLIWRDRDGTRAPDDMQAYVAGTVRRLLNDALTRRSTTNSELGGPESDDRASPHPDPAEPPSDDVDRHDLVALRVVLRLVETDLLGAGRVLAAEFERRSPHVTTKQARMFNEIFNVTTVTVRLLSADMRTSAILEEDDLDAPEPAERPWVLFLSGLSSLRDKGDRLWIKPWTFRAMCLTEAIWAAHYGATVYPGALRNNTHEKRLNQITAGGKPEDYKEETARGGAVSLLGAVLAPSIDFFEQTRSHVRRGGA